MKNVFAFLIIYMLKNYQQIIINKIIADKLNIVYTIK